MDKLIDNYLNHALKFDALGMAIIWFINSNFSLFEFDQGTQDNNLAILSDLISASISLAGFILASLTIIAAIKSNITNKAPETAKNPLELFFSSKNYSKIIEVFQGSIKELTFCFISAYCVWISIGNISLENLFKINICLIFLTSISIIRSLLVLFKIINIKE